MTIPKQIVRDWRVTLSENGKLVVCCRLTGAHGWVTEYTPAELAALKFHGYVWHDTDRIKNIVEAEPRTDERSPMEQSRYYRQGVRDGMWWGWGAASLVGFSFSCWFNGHWIVAAVLSVAAMRVLWACWAIRK